MFIDIKHYARYLKVCLFSNIQPRKASYFKKKYMFLSHGCDMKLAADPSIVARCGAKHEMI